MNNKRINWNLDLVKLHGSRIHNNKYTYLGIIKGQGRTKINILCDCGHNFTQSVNMHIDHGRGCKKCNQSPPYTYDILVEKGKATHGDDYDYSSCLLLDKIRSDTKIPIKCNECGLLFYQILQAHINSRQGCPSCAGNIPYTYDVLIKKAKMKHGDKYDYSSISPDYKLSAKIKIEIKCNECLYIFTQNISHHVNRGDGCPRCSNSIPYNYDVLVAKGLKVHGMKYDYSNNKKLEKISVNTEISIICNKCKYVFNQIVNNHINDQNGCTRCKFYKGEEKIRKYMENNEIDYVSEYIIHTLPRKRFDIFANSKYIIEYDGKQHFEYNNHFYKDMSDFEKRLEIDVIKSVEALKHGYIVIRISYETIDVNKYLDYVFNTDGLIYLSHAKLYKNHIDNILKILPDIEDRVRIGFD